MSAALRFEYRWRDAALYALGIGAGPQELEFVYEGGPDDPPMRVFPTYAVIPAYEACKALFDVVGGDFSGVVHGGQAVRIHRALAPDGVLTTVGRVASIGDLRRLAQVVFTTETRDEDGALVCETEWTIMYLLDGGFGGAPPPKSPRVRAPERAPDWTVRFSTSPSQALLYRLSGDLNPLHADPRAAARAEKVTGGRPILHGLCTYGFVGRAILARECANDPARLRFFSARFSRPVWPGDTLIVDGWREEGRVLVQAHTEEHPDEPVLTSAWAEIRD